MTFHIITLFPEVFGAYFRESIIGKAIKKRLVKIKFYDLKEFSIDKKHRKVDDRVYGGGPGMVLGIEPLVRAINKATARQTGLGGKRQAKIILLSAGGRQFDNKYAQELSKHKDVVLIAGRYEGVDERIKKLYSVEEVSVGPYVLTGGEVPAMVIVDAVSRQIKGVLGKEESIEEKRYGIGVPVYTRPEVFKHRGKNYRVPKVLLSGNHKEIEDWRMKHRGKRSKLDI
ncbi:MAG: tRNA (guanosine(37)-N1)-methyltransferase TrmD [Candidatus Colwellbacteria bacterium RIFCSPLOWO2_12_FULL_46_17]|uniref:tRNA (guanine-N(1)-)-methyltransferase n=2 Tax=Parcubacteria group TaxID=1794811 RepID=A0A0H4T7J5_9BACT|nr:tRNA (guanine-N1)-methyltransferase, tRNA (guanine37-N1)-methyltransferase [uncultured Parcubacteria bacterium Rifle_16ft_4_minimus_37647]OGY62757.1 MAG: tRNA (guanosine(37)-N1)-methyltransferase TrmD [Candidatus Colwellbacteria bacterium RIFCSPLOWO2_12_FULL_46_17]